MRQRTKSRGVPVLVMNVVPKHKTAVGNLDTEAATQMMCWQERIVLQSQHMPPIRRRAQKAFQRKSNDQRKTIGNHVAARHEQWNEHWGPSDTSQTTNRSARRHCRDESKTRQKKERIVIQLSASTSVSRRRNCKGKGQPNKGQRPRSK